MRARRFQVARKVATDSELRAGSAVRQPSSLRIPRPDWRRVPYDGGVAQPCSMKIADLLYAVPRLRVNTLALGETLTFAFATGGTGEAFERIVNATVLEATLWKADCFADDLFLDEFVRRCMRVVVDGKKRDLHRGYLRRVLTSPSSPEDARYRQQILQELATHAPLRRDAEKLWKQVHDLLALLTSAELSKRLDAIHRQMDILRATKAAIDLMAESFEGAESGLASLREFGRSIRKGPGYENLRDLLDYEANLATVDVRLRLGFDGHLRGFKIVRAEENQTNPFYITPLVRFWSRIRMLFRGYRVRERELLGRLVYGVFDGVEKNLHALFQIQADLEVHLASLGFRDLASEQGLSVCLASFDGVSTRLSNLFNPFLLFEESPPIPCDVAAQPGDIVVITGPNSGGKTRLLQALGLCQMLGQAGLFAPAEQAQLLFTEGLFVSLIHGATPDAREGRLGTELLRIRRLFEKLSVGSLVLLDELCSGTNPSEGEEIFELVVGLLAEVEPQAFISTHFLQFAGRLERETRTKGLQFLQVGLDDDQEPTYHFLPGVASTSLAQKTAERLGVTRDALAELVRERQREYRRRHGQTSAPPPSRSDGHDGGDGKIVALKR